MTGATWIILNLLLAIGAIYGTVSAIDRSEPEPLVLKAPEEKENAVKGGKAERQPAPAPRRNEKSTIASADMDDLWQMSLFTPSRAENPDAAADAAQNAAAAAASQNIQFELVGIAQIAAEGKESVPVAILRSRAASGRGPASRFRRPAQQPQQPTESSSKQKEVFALGEAINDSGYVVKSIDPETRSVEVSRAGTVVKLQIDFKDDDAAKRSENAVAESKKRNEAHEQAANARNAAIMPLSEKEKQESRTPPAPPGSTSQRNTAVPGKPATQNSTGTVNSWGSNRNSNEDSQEQAANAARSARIQQLLERRRKARQQQNTPAPGNPR